MRAKSQGDSKNLFLVFAPGGIQRLKKYDRPRERQIRELL
jgi:hypothetical protein